MKKVYKIKMEEEDFAFALSLQNEFSSTFINNDENNHKKDSRTSVVDECWETIDPTPDIRQLFLEFNDTYFDGKLSGCEVRWSPRMTLCAGLCCYEGRGGLCSIRLSLPLLKLRPRKDLVQTLLHEMIHALLFVTNNNKDHDAHGPEFHKHMYRINKQSGANITVYHNFHDEVNEYRQHWWRCNGPCQKRPPYYGMVKRSMNRAPSPRDIWWADHQQKCGGTYTKVKEPEDYGKKKKKSKEETTKHDNKYVSSHSGMQKIDELWKKEPDTFDSLTKGKENDTPKSNNVGSIPAIIPFAGKGFVLGGHKTESSTITRPWLLNKHSSASTASSKDRNEKQVVNIISSPSNEHPEIISKKKRKKVHNGGTIIDAFKKVEKSKKKTPVVIIDDDSPTNLVECPLCQIKIQENMINPHLDNCLS